MKNEILLSFGFPYVKYQDIFTDVNVLKCISMCFFFLSSKFVKCQIIKMTNKDEEHSKQ